MEANIDPDEERQRREFRRIGALVSSAVWRAKENKAREWRRRRTIGAFVSRARSCAETSIPSLSDCGRQSAPHRLAIASHLKALQNPPGPAEIVPLAGLSHDAFPRALTKAICSRLAPLAGDAAFGVTRATVAVEADAAAALLVVSEPMARRLHVKRPVRIVSATRRGGDPGMPGAAPIAAAKSLLAAERIAPARIAVAEVMEAFAAQAIACVDGIGVPESALNRGGGGLARGHPIGASGAILAVRLWHEMQSESSGALGLAAIAAAGGLGSALLATV